MSLCFDIYQSSLFRHRPQTLKNYLLSLAGFMNYLCVAGKWSRHLRMKTHELLQLREVCKDNAKSLDDDINKEAVERFVVECRRSLII